MIYLLIGENEFLKRERLHELVSSMGVEPERIDGDALEPGGLRELLQGQTLFSESRALIVTDLSEGPAWPSLSDMSAETDSLVILVEKKVDKRTSAYKWLKKHVTVEEFLPIGERETGKVVAWCLARAKDTYDMELTRPLATALVERLGHDQLRLDGTLEQLSLAETIDKDLIDRVVPLPRTENVFELFEAALRGERSRVHDIIAYLELTLGLDGAYQTLGLLVSQLVPLNALVSGGAPGDIAKDFSTHLFVVQKLGAYARQLSASQVRQMNEALGRADMAMKTTSASPWLLLEAALVEVGVIAQ